jgi:hypothetical protein
LGTNEWQEIGGFDPSIPDELNQKIEAARTSEQRQKMDEDAAEARSDKTQDAHAVGRQIRAWARDWVKENLSEQEKAEYEKYAAVRLRAGRSAPSLDLLEKLEGILDKPFANRHELDRWIEGQGITGLDARRTRSAVTGDKTVSIDTILAFDASTGRKLWQKDFPGELEHWGMSGTPCVKNGRLYWVGSAGVYCVSADDGGNVWHTPGREFRSHCSPAVEDGVMLFAAGGVRALDAATGEQLWSFPEKTRRAKGFCYGSNVSAAIRWVDEQARAIIFSGRNLLSLDVKTGHLHWQERISYSMATPIIRGDTLIIQGNRRHHALTAYRLRPDGLESFAQTGGPFGASAASSALLLPGERVLAIGGKGAVCLSLAEGKIVFENTDFQADYASPVYADGKILLAGSRKLLLLKAEKDNLRQLASAPFRLSKFPSPAFADGLLYARGKNEHDHPVINCYDLRANQEP